MWKCVKAILWRLETRHRNVKKDSPQARKHKHQLILDASSSLSPPACHEWAIPLIIIYHRGHRSIRSHETRTVTISPNCVIDFHRCVAFTRLQHSHSCWPRGITCPAPRNRSTELIPPPVRSCEVRWKSNKHTRIGKLGKIQKKKNNAFLQHNREHRGMIRKTHHVRRFWWGQGLSLCWCFKKQVYGVVLGKSIRSTAVFLTSPTAPARDRPVSVCSAVGWARQSPVSVARPPSRSALSAPARRRSSWPAAAPIGTVAMAADNTALASLGRACKSKQKTQRNDQNAAHHTRARVSF